MSWSFQAVGTPENLQKALDADAETLTGDSKAEFEEAKPHLVALIRMNVNPHSPPTLRVDASGHASRNPEGETTYSNCVVTIVNLNARLV
jgi:hypothetical protein